MVQALSEFGVGGNTDTLYDGSLTQIDIRPDSSNYHDVVSWVTVLGWTVVMAFASGLGGLPLFFMKEIPGHVNGESRTAQFMNWSGNKAYILYSRYNTYTYALQCNMTCVWVGVASALACGVMLSAAYNLIYEGERSGRAPVVVGLFAGAAFMSASKTLLMSRDASLIPSEPSQKRASLILATMMLHAVGEGIGVGCSFSSTHGMRRGMLLTCAIAFQNIPEG